MRAILMLAFLAVAYAAVEPQLLPVQLPEPAIPYVEPVRVVESFGEKVSPDDSLRVVDFVDIPVPEAGEFVNFVDNSDVPANGGFQEIAPSELESLRIPSPPEDFDSIPYPYYNRPAYRDPMWR